MLKSYQAGIAGIRWAVSERNDAEPVLQYALHPIHGGAPDWFDVPTEAASLPVIDAKPAKGQCEHGARSEQMCSVCSRRG